MRSVTSTSRRQSDASPSTLARFLAGVDPFHSLPPAELARLAAVCAEKRYAKGETIFREGDQSDAVWIVKTGRVHLTRFRTDGKVSTTCVMTPKETFCCLPALDRSTYPADGVVAEECAVIRIPSDAFHEILARSPVFTRQTLCLFCNRLRQVEYKGCMVYESAEQRLAEVLLTLSKKFGDTIPLTRQELAELAGTTHETAIRTLSRFKDKGLIRSSRGQTTIVSPSKLSAHLP